MARSTPIASIHVLSLVSRGRSGRSSETYVEPDTITEAQSYRMNRGNIKFYNDDSGKYPVPPEWKKSGVTVIAEDMTGGFRNNSWIYYGFEIGK